MTASKTPKPESHDDPNPTPKLKSIPKKASKKPPSYRKQWKLLCEYAVARHGKPDAMNLSDTVYEHGPTVGDFLLTHFLTRVVMPLLKPVPVEEPVPEENNTTEQDKLEPEPSTENICVPEPAKKRQRNHASKKAPKPVMHIATNNNNEK